jgi:hypothetical protein
MVRSGTQKLPVVFTEELNHQRILSCHCCSGSWEYRCRSSSFCGWSTLSKRDNAVGCCVETRQSPTPPSLGELTAALTYGRSIGRPFCCCEVGAWVSDLTQRNTTKSGTFC